MNYALLADVTVVIHFLYACFVLFGLLAIAIGIPLHWSWTRNLCFRIVHLACTVFVPLETVVGMTCPLTELENFLLRAAGSEGCHRYFMGRLVTEILYYEAPEWIFTVTYGGLAFSATLLFFMYPPTGLAHRKGGTNLPLCSLFIKRKDSTLK